MNDKKHLDGAQDKKILDAAVRSSGLLAQASHVFTIHPMLGVIAASFAGFVGPHSLAENGSHLLEHGLQTAFGRYKHAMDEMNNEQAAKAAFVKTLIDMGIEVFAQQMLAETPQGDVLWFPFMQSAADFLEKYKGSNITTTRVPLNVSEGIAMAWVICKVIPDSMRDNDSINEIFQNTKVVL